MEGGNLTPREAAELAVLKGRAGKGALKPGTADYERYLELAEKEGLPGLVLEPGDVGSTLEDLARLYCFDGAKVESVVRTLKRWKTVGKKAGVLPPLSRPEEMQVWYEGMVAAGHFKRGVPDVILRAAVMRRQEPVAKEEEKAARPAPEVSVDVAEMSPRKMLERLEREEARLHGLYLQAVTDQKPQVEQDQARKRWADMSDLLQLQRTRISKNKELLDPEEVNASWRKLVEPLPEALLAAFPKTPPEGGSWLETVRAAIQQAWARLPKALEDYLTAA